MPRKTREKIASLLISPLQRIKIILLIQTMMSLVGLNIATMEDLRSIINSGKEALLTVALCIKMFCLNANLLKALIPFILS